MDVEMAETTLKLPSTCADVGEVETIIDEIFFNIDTPQLLKIDMSDVVYLTAPCMIYLISFTHNVLDRGYDVKFRLPREKSIRHILRIWRFPIVLKEVTGRGFSTMVLNEDLVYFGESTLQGDYYRKFALNDDGLAELVRKDFFSITSIPFTKENEKSVAIDHQYQKWSEEIIKSILKRHLATYDGENENLIPNRIIYECMTNAFRHSRAVKLVTGSYFDQKGGSFLTITYWDNGESIIKTLSKALAENQLARVKDNVNANLHFSMAIKSNFDDEGLGKYYHSDSNPSTSSSESELLLAAVTPGVSRDPHGKDSLYAKNPYMESENQHFNKPGMGLTTLLNAAIDLLDGKVAIRSGSYFVNFKKPLSREYDAYKNSKEYRFKTLYRAKVVKYGKHMPTFKGNMITIRLPLNKL